MYNATDQQQLIEQSRQFLQGKQVLAADNLAAFRDILRFHEWRYYVQNDPVLADPEYDQLFKQLAAFEAAHPDLVTPDSPTQRVASDLTKDFPEVAHLRPMLSLDNSYNEEDLSDWDRRVRSFLPENATVTYSVEPKFDGASIAIVYEDDNLVRGTTRGNGTTGEEVTPNVKVMRTVPLKAPFSSHGIKRIEVRGEVMINKAHFQQFNEQRMAEGLSILANPRNAASGSMRMQDPKEVAKRGLEAYLYQVGVAEDAAGNSVLEQAVITHADSIALLNKLGFKTPTEEIRICSTIAEVIAYCKEWEQKRDDYPYEIDGMVIKVNRFDQQELCGYTSHHPRWAIAFKFKARQATTRLKAIEYQVGRTGAVTPVAKLDPVHIGGVTVSSVSLFNADVVREKDLMIGDRVLVERAGDVIPYIVKSLADERTGVETAIVFPTHCPSCDSELVKPEEEAVWRCVNINCPAQSVERIIHFVSKGAMDIDGLGEKFVRRLFTEKQIATIADLYRLDWDTIRTWDGVGEKSIQNLQQALAQSTSQSLDRLIFGLGIRYVGQTTAKVLAKQVNVLTDFADWSQEQLLALPDVGPKVAESIEEFFGNEQNLMLIRELAELGLNINGVEDAGPSSLTLEGLTFVITGTLPTLSRNDAKALIEDNGGKVTGSVSKNTDYLLLGEDAGSKYDKAVKLGVPTLSEEELLEKLTG